MKTINIANILKGCKAGRIQSVGFMQIIPLISDIVDNNIVSPKDVYASTSTYGTLSLTNKGEYATIFPSGGGVVTKQNAQDHASPKGIFIGKNQRATTTQARCIQSTQGGEIRECNDYHFTIIPHYIREFSLKDKDKRSYSELWPAIEEFNVSLGLINRGHVDYYLTHFNQQLNDFIAQFEIVPKMVGAIILINGEVYGIERVPNYDFWKYMWRPLIREAYGSEVIRYTKTNKGAKPISRIPLASANIRSIKDLSNALSDTEQKEEIAIKNMINGFLKTKFQRTVEQNANEYTFETIENKQFVGQVLHDDEGCIYSSLVSKKTFKQNPTTVDFSDSEEFSM